MKIKFYLTILSLFVLGFTSCSNETLEPQQATTDIAQITDGPMTRNAYGAYYIRSSAGLAQFNNLYQYDNTLKCVLAYTKTSLSTNDFPTNKQSIYGIDMPYLTSVGSNGFYGLTSLIDVNLPNCLSVGDFGFGDCNALIDISLPKCTTLGNQVFWTCESLETVSLPECTTAGHSLFFRCPSLVSVDLSECTEIEYNVFAVCVSLTSVDLSSAQSVGRTAFGDCSSLTSISLPVCTYLDDYVFRNCDNLTSLSLNSASPITTFTNTFTGLDTRNQVYLYLRYNGYEYRNNYVGSCGYSNWKSVTFWNGGGPTVPGPGPGPVGDSGAA